MTPKYKLSARAKGLLAKLDPIDSFLDEAGDYLESEMMRFPGFGRGTCAEVKAHLIASGKLVYSDEALLEMTSYQGRLNKFGELLAGMGFPVPTPAPWQRKTRTVGEAREARPTPADVQALVEALGEAVDVFDGMSDDEINDELLPRLRSALAPFRTKEEG